MILNIFGFTKRKFLCELALGRKRLEGKLAKNPFD